MNDLFTSELAPLTKGMRIVVFRDTPALSWWLQMHPIIRALPGTWQPFSLFYHANIIHLIALN